jgi:glutathione synthase/RimK-type ligase-like ATP-grasp enzyme
VATVVNRPAAAASNFTKPIQTKAAMACGFHVPGTLLTNDLEKARAFAARHGQVVYKAAGGTPSFTGLLDLSDTRRLEQLGTCPTYFQQYIAGTNVRVHVVGKDVFAVEITSDAIDYRRDTHEMFPTSLPEAIAEKCRIVSRALGLLAAGIDLIRSADGKWYFLEANPSPAFTFYPDRDDVAAAVARLLTSPPERRLQPFDRNPYRWAVPEVPPSLGRLTARIQGPRI